MYIEKSVTVEVSQVKSANRDTDVGHKAASHELHGVTITTLAEQTVKFLQYVE